MVVAEQLSLPGLAVTRWEVLEIQVEWERDDDGYSSVSDYLGKFIQNDHDSSSAAVFDRENGWLLGEEVDRSELAQLWFNNTIKTFGDLKKTMRSYHAYKGQWKYRERVRTCQCIDWELMWETQREWIEMWLDYGVCSETNRRILAHRCRETHVDRNSMKWVEPSLNYNLKDGRDWGQNTRGGEGSEIRAFNSVSHWPPKGDDGKRIHRGREIKPFNGWKRYGINPVIDSMHPPGFWVNVFYACEDHARLEDYEDGDWQVYAIMARATFREFVKIGDDEETLIGEKTIETGWTTGYDSDDTEENLKSIEREKLDDLQSEVEAAGLTWPENPDYEVVGDQPYY